MITNLQLVAFLKDLTAGNNSTFSSLSPEKATKFISLIRDQSQVLKEWTMQPMGAMQRNISLITAGTRRLRRVAQGSDPEDTQKANMTTGGKKLIAEELDLFETIGFDFLIDNTEGNKVEATIAKGLAMALANDIVDLSINGDTTDTSADKDFLTLNDGIIKLAKGSADTHVFDTNGSTDYKGVVFPGLFGELPDKWKNTPDLTIYCSPTALEGYQDQLATRSTNAGDRAILQGDVDFYKGRKIRAINSWPQGIYMLTPASNIVVGLVKNQMQNYREVKFSKRCIDYTFVTYHDVQIAIDDACVIGYDKP